MADDQPWLRNPGYRIAGVDTARVFVRLRNGVQPPESWAVDARTDAPGCRWSLRGDPWDIVEFRIAA